MNRLNFNQSVGFPLETEILAEMQKAWSVFNFLGDIVGNFTIISGCVVTGSTVSDGCVNINGEILPFKGGNIQATVFIKEDIQSLEFEDGNAHDVVFTRYVKFGTATVNQYNWVDFKRGIPTKELQAIFDTKANNAFISTLVTRIEELENRPLANVPIGLVALWDQPANLIPAGWVEHVPMRGRMAIGQDPSYDGSTNGDVVNFNLNVQGSVGGFRQRKITATEMPAKLNTSKPYATGGTTGDYLSPDTTNVALPTLSPYRVVHFIRYVGV